MTIADIMQTAPVIPVIVVDEVEQAVVDAYETAYSSYYHAAVVLGGGLVR